MTAYLHGFASGVGSRKARFFRERLPDLAVPGLDRDGFEDLTISGQLRVVEEMRPRRLIGSSMGGYLAALYAARHPEVERLVLLAPAFGFARRWAESLGQEKLEAWRRTGRLEVHHYGEGRTRSVGWGLIEDGRRYEDYPDVTQPALIFHGRFDDVVPAAYSEEFAAGRPAVTLELLDSDHELLNVLDHIWERSRAFLTDSL